MGTIQFADSKLTRHQPDVLRQLVFLAGWVMTWREESSVAEVFARRCGGWPIARCLSIEFASGSCLNVYLLKKGRGLAGPVGLWLRMASREQPRYGLPELC